jgi:hypothetical protein
MLRRSSKPDSVLGRKQQELAQQENQLRDQVEKLERMLADAPRVAEQVERRQREELLMRASESRLDVSLALRDKRYGDDVGAARPRGSLRKERREGRIVFLVLIIALGAAVIWLLSHLHF